MHSKLSSTPPRQISPRQYADGSYAAVVHHRLDLGAGRMLLRVALPLAAPAQAATGLFFMARCVADNRREREQNWSIYSRRALMVAGQPTALVEGQGYGWDLYIADSAEAGGAWLSRRALNSAINVLGPFGQAFPLTTSTNTLLVLATAATLPLMLPAIHTLLDRGGRVTVLLLAAQPAADNLAALLPIPVEVRTVAQEAQLWPELDSTIRWADQLCAALPSHLYPPLATVIRQQRFRLEAGFAHVYLAADLLCGFGACLACVVPTPNGGYTRACIHGPFFPLEAIVR